MKTKKINIEEQKILQELEAEKVDYEAVEYIAVQNQEEEKKQLKAVVEESVKQKISVY